MDKELNLKTNIALSNCRIKQLITLMALIGFFLHFTTLVYSSNSVYFKRILGENNICSNYVNDIIQRSDGFIWMATSDGVHRYDGYNFVSLKSSPYDPKSLPNPWVNKLLEDHLNQLWVGTTDGLARLLPDELHFENFKFSPDNEESVAGKNINSIFEDSQNNLWIATNSGLSLYMPETNNFKNYFIDHNQPTNQINQINVIVQKNNQQLWIGNSQGLFVFDVPSRTFKAHNIPLNESIEIGIQDIDIDSKG